MDWQAKEDLGGASPEIVPVSQRMHEILRSPRSIS